VTLSSFHHLSLSGDIVLKEPSCLPTMVVAYPLILSELLSLLISSL